MCSENTNEVEVLEENEVAELIPAFEESLFSPVWDTSIDYFELGVDTLFKDGLLKDIPIVSSIIGAGKFVYNIADRNAIKQLLVFINEYNQCTISPNKLEEHRLKLRSNSRNLEKELGRIMIILNRNIDSYKSVIEARFYSAYIEVEISWGVFCELCDITERMFLSDINTLKSAYQNSGVTLQMRTSYRHDRLISIGLLKEGMASRIIDLDDTNPQYVYVLTEIGKIYCRYAFEKN